MKQAPMPSARDFGRAGSAASLACRTTPDDRSRMPHDRKPDSAPTLDALKKASGMSRFHFHRIFRSVTGSHPVHVPRRTAPRGFALN
jgi:AraC-like DNA-binding protein